MYLRIGTCYKKVFDNVSKYYLEMWDVFANQSENFDSFASHSLLSLVQTRWCC